MKGVIFTEFLKFVEEQFDILVVDHLITATNPVSNGAYTAVGTYDSGELIAMIVELSTLKKLPASDLVKSFGEHLFGHLVESHASTLGNVSTTEQLLASVEGRIHVDVRKLYPDAELPTISFLQIDEATSELIYASTRPFADLAEGLIASAIKHFQDPISIAREDLPPGNGTSAKFTLTRKL
jgi:hypothetical protein